MNKKQRWAIVAGMALLILSALFPPWYAVLNFQAGPQVVRYGFSFLSSPPTATDYPLNARIDFYQLLAEWLLIVLLTLGAWIALRDIKALVS